MAIQFHAGNREVQDEANSRPAADMLAGRSRGAADPIHDFMRTADIVLLAMADAAGRLGFQSVSGAAPLVQGEISGAITFPDGIALPSEPAALAGGIAIDLATRRRSRLNGTLSRADGRLVFCADEVFANCRKYVAASTARELSLHVGPSGRRAVAVDDPGLQQAVSAAETAFVASLGVTGLPDVSHRGGPLGFVTLDGATGTVRWPELIGNGMFKTAGNVRATGTLTLLVLDVTSGDAYELSGQAEYRTVLRYEQPRERPLWPHTEDFPAQGEMTLHVARAFHLQRLVNPRRRLLDEAKVTSCSPAEDQIPR